MRVVGGAGWGDVDVESGGVVSDDEPARLYRGATCLVYPSLYESFRTAGARGDCLRDACG
jgi:glycosyltransferase involved in cell wall biosynthesis